MSKTAMTVLDATEYLPQMRSRAVFPASTSAVAGGSRRRTSTRIAKHKEELTGKSGGGA